MVGCTDVTFSDVEVSDEFDRLVRLQLGNKRSRSTDEPYVRVETNPDCVGTGLSYSFNVRDVIEKYHEMFSSEVFEFFQYPSSQYFTVHGVVDGFLKETREGQLLLERVVCEETPWEERLLSLEALEVTGDSVISLEEARFRNGVGAIDGKWEAEEDTSLQEWAAEQQPLEEMIGIPVHGVIRYVLRLMDSEGVEYLYVGRTERVLQRLSAHINEGGDFRKARHSDNEMVVIDIEELRRDVSEAELYEEACEKYDIPRARVYGGR